MARRPAKSLDSLQSWESFSCAYKAATHDERLLYTTLMLRLLTEQGQQSQETLPTQMFTLQRLVVQELREILEFRNCKKICKAIDLMNSSLAPQDLWTANQWVQEGCKEADAATDVVKSAERLARDLLVIRCCLFTDNMNPDRFRLVMQSASSGEELDDGVLAKLALCHSRIVALGSADAAAGKHVKLVRDEMSSALVQDFRPGQKGKVTKIDEDGALLLTAAGEYYWIPVNYLNTCTYTPSKYFVEVHTAFTVQFAALVINEFSTGNILVGPQDGQALIQLSPPGSPAHPVV